MDRGALLCGLPADAPVAFRAGHFDLDVYPSHAVLQGSLTVLLAGIYLLPSGCWPRSSLCFGGENAFALKGSWSSLAPVLFTILLLSDRVRLHHEPVCEPAFSTAAL